MGRPDEALPVLLDEGAPAPLLASSPDEVADGPDVLADGPDVLAACPDELEELPARGDVVHAIHSSAERAGAYRARMRSTALRR